MWNPRFAILPLCVCVLCGSLPINAAVAANKNESRLDRPATDVIDEIVVTATRRATPLQDTALSVGVLAGEYIERARIRGFDHYWRQIPSMSVTDSGPFGTGVTIRGLSQNYGADSGSGLTSTYIDDTLVTNSAMDFSSPPDLYLLDIDRVEVMRGPQGTLFGAGSVGGAVRTITNKPDPTARQFEIETTASATKHGGSNFGVTGVLNQPLAEGRTAFRLAAFLDDSDGFVDDIGQQQSNVNWERTAGFRLSAMSFAGDNLRVDGKFQYQKREAGSFDEVDPNGKPEIGLATHDDYQLALLVPESRSDELTLLGLDLNYEAPWGTMTSVTSYFENELVYVIDIADEMNTFFGQYLPVPIDGGFSQKTFTQEFRIAGAKGTRLDWLGGLFYLDEEVPEKTDIPAPGFNSTPFCIDVDPPPPFGAPSPTCSGQPDGEENLWFGSAIATRMDYGVFGDASYRFSERWEASVGARWYDIRKRFSDKYEGFFVGGFGPSVADGRIDESSEDGVNLKASLAFRPNDDVMLYGLASQGFRPGANNDPFIVEVCAFAPESYESDTVWNYEIGARTQWRDTGLTVNATAYRIDWTDAQVSIFSVDCGNYYTANSGKAESHGIEVEINALISDRWDLAFSAGYTSAKLAAPLVDPDINAPTGTELPNVPGVTASLISTYTFPVLGDSQGFVQFAAQYTGTAYSTLDLDSRIKKPSYTLVDLGGGVESGRWRTELFIDNLLDDKGIYSCCRINGEYVVNRPRTVGLRVSYAR